MASNVASCHKKKVLSDTSSVSTGPDDCRTLLTLLFYSMFNVTVATRGPENGAGTGLRVGDHKLRGVKRGNSWGVSRLSFFPHLIRCPEQAGLAVKSKRSGEGRLKLHAKWFFFGWI